MNHNEITGFYIGCALAWDLDSAEVDEILQEFGLNAVDGPLYECQQAIRHYVGEDAFQLGLAIIKRRVGA